MEGAGVIVTSGKLPQVVETLWLEDIVHAEVKTTDGHNRILLYTLRNGRRFSIPLSGATLRLTQQGISPVALPAGVNVNGHGA